MVQQQVPIAHFLFRSMSEINVHNGRFAYPSGAAALATSGLDCPSGVLKLVRSADLSYGDLHRSARQQAQGPRCFDLRSCRTDDL